ncbi:MAG: hypothetical protein L3J99_06210 [Thermoplasmata archaeon]|nr:hypothetical protein [Thermoplasmata archaeon]
MPEFPGARRARGPPGLPALVVGIAAILVVAAFTVPDKVGPPCGTSGTRDTSTPIRHVFILVQENHAFENYFGDFPGVIGYPPNGSFPLSFTGAQTVSPFPLGSNSTPDYEHDRAAELVDWNQGRNNLFVAEAAHAALAYPQGTLGYYTRAQLAGYYSLAESYGLGDRFFSGVLGPTAPNRVFDITGYSGNGWYTDSPPPPNLTARPTILTQLSEYGVPWAYDYAGAPQNLAPDYFSSITGDRCSTSRIVSASNLSSQLALPTVPSVVYLDSSNSPTVSEHPAQNISVGEAWTLGNIDAILKSRVASSSLILLFYDEAGGFWDPVPPPMTSTGLDGFRVPFLVISPWTPAHTVCATVLDPASVLHFIDMNWMLPDLNPRIASAASLGCFLHFESAPRTLGPAPSIE